VFYISSLPILKIILKNGVKNLGLLTTTIFIKNTSVSDNDIGIFLRPQEKEALKL